MTQALLLRVGVDSASGRAHGPLFDDGRFEYVPIPESEDEETAEVDTYRDLRARTGGTLDTYVQHLDGRTPHHDPEFLTDTYGDPGNLKRSQLSGLASGDLLVFYAGLRSVDESGTPDGATPPRLYAIGYLTVAATHDLEAMTDDERRAFVESHPHNAHCKRLRADLRRRSEHFPVVVRGVPTKSGLFTRARPLAREDQYPLCSVERLTGVSGSLTRAGVARRLDGERIDTIRDWLDRGAAAFATDETRLHVRVDDSRPRTGGGYGSLAGAVESGAIDAEDWVLGVTTRGAEPRLTSLCHVDEVVPWSEYHATDRFAPNRSGAEETAVTETVAVASLFWSFDPPGVSLPAGLWTDLGGTSGSASRTVPSRVDDSQAIQRLVAWLAGRFRPGVHG